MDRQSTPKALFYHYLWHSFPDPVCLQVISSSETNANRRTLTVTHHGRDHHCRHTCAPAFPHANINATAHVYTHVYTHIDTASYPYLHADAAAHPHPNAYLWSFCVWSVGRRTRFGSVAGGKRS
jgi:hypothetical protein